MTLDDIKQELGQARKLYTLATAHQRIDRMIALLERLQEPTEGMIQAMRFTNRKTLRGQLRARFKAGVKAAEEAK